VEEGPPDDGDVYLPHTDEQRPMRESTEKESNTSMDASATQGKELGDLNGNEPYSSDAYPDGARGIQRQVVEVDYALARLYEASPAGTLFLVANQCDLSRFRHRMSRKQRYLYFDKSVYR